MQVPRKSDRLISSIETLEPLVLMSAGVTDLEAVHKDGQTFLTWQEDTTLAGEEYHVYRHTEAITEDNIDQAELLTGRWGPLDDDTSFHQLAGNGAPQNFVIEDLGSALSDDTGLFVYTTQDGESGDAFYAVTLVVDGNEQSLSSSGDQLAAAVQESVAETSPILVSSFNGGKSLVFTQFMDYKDWNPTFQGYAYDYSVALPQNYDPSQRYELRVEMHAYTEGHRLIPESEFGWDVIQLFVDDPGLDRGTVHTWWYGFAADHNYEADGPIPTGGTIENFTEQRVLKAIDEVIANDAITIDTSRINAFGHSMGASAALAMGIRYGDVFAAIYASEGMTDYAASAAFQDEFVQLWGSQQSNLQIVNNGKYAGPIAQYGVGGSDPTGVWDWMDHGEQIVRLRGLEMSFFNFGHGKADTAIPWETQGQPFMAAVDAADVGYSAEQRGDWDHTWMGFEFLPKTLFSDANGNLNAWYFSGNDSHLAISNATDSGTPTPTQGGTDYYNQTIDWATPTNPFHTSAVDTADHYEISVRSTTSIQTADITPRNFQNFRVNPGDVVSWQNVDNSSGAILEQGQVTVDADGLLTLTNVSVTTGTGNRLILSADPSRPTAPPPVLETPPVVDPPPVVEPPPAVEPPPVVEVDPVEPTVDPEPPEANTPQSPTDGTTPSDPVAPVEPPTTGETTPDASSPEGNSNSSGSIEGETEVPVDDVVVEESPNVDPNDVPPTDVTNEFGEAAESGADDGGDDVSSPISVAVERLEATADTMLTSMENASANLGGAETLAFYAADGGQRTALLKFDTSSLNGDNVHAAALQLQQLAHLYSDSAMEISVFAVAAPWQEGAGSDNWSAANGGATWQSEGGGQLVTDFDFGNGANGLITTLKLDGSGPADGTAKFDVTAAVNAWLDGRLQNHGLALVVTSGEYSEYVFASSEANDANSRPALLVQSLPGPLPSPNPQPMPMPQDGPNGIAAEDAQGFDAFAGATGEVLDATSQGADGEDAFGSHDQGNASNQQFDDLTEVVQEWNGFQSHKRGRAFEMSQESSTNYIFPSANAFHRRSGL